MRSNRFSYLATAAAVILTATLLVKCTKKETPAIAKTTTDSPTFPNSFNRLSVSTFVHPGVINTKATLDFIAGEANNTSTARYNDYNNTVLDYINNHPMPTSYPATIHVEGGTTTPDEKRFKGDGLLAYAIALRWAKTGTASYATQVKQILDGWSTHFTNITNNSGTSFSQTYLEASWAAPNFAAAAEIIKWYVPANGVGGGWTATENTNFTNFLNNLKNNYINNVTGMGYHNNWDISAGYAKMAIGVFEDSPAVYSAGEDIITSTIPSVIASDGTDVELCDRNDCHHFQYSLTGISYAATISAIQGDNIIYGANGSRLSAGYDYMRAAYNNQKCIPCSGQYVYPGVEIARRHYQTANLTSLRAIGAPYEIPSDITFLGFTTYTHYNVPL
ncbi:MAG: alginate lyase family protein [Mucilaginibacter sp.]|uniref:alginate lyase family protein n=1 Tax=Mucilaginibacter sp. TaxID=1882438 RepID=UPI0032634741